MPEATSMVARMHGGPKRSWKTTLLIIAPKMSLSGGAHHHEAPCA
jgi:hypothetical protein